MWSREDIKKMSKWAFMDQYIHTGRAYYTVSWCWAKDRGRGEWGEADSEAGGSSLKATATMKRDLWEPWRPMRTLGSTLPWSCHRACGCDGKRAAFLFTDPGPAAGRAGAMASALRSCSPTTTS